MTTAVLKLLLLHLTVIKLATCKPPHIVFILADDLGWNDVSFHGSDQIMTPNIDALAYSGVILHQHYGEAMCCPSRAALLTGKYPIRTGMQHNMLLEPEPRGLPLTETLLPQHLNRLGYESHAIGKWHMGFFKREYTPIYRGFKSHYGFWNGYQDYYNHMVQASFINYQGYDMRFNETVRWEDIGHYSTDLFTQRAIDIISNHNKTTPLFLYFAHLAVHAGNYGDPLQAPQEYIDRFNHIPDLERRKFAGMVAKLDESVGKVVTALKEADMLNDSIIVLISDNGAATRGLHKNFGSNWPLKGEKATVWEGALRSVGMVWSRLLEKPHRVSKQLMHISDWLPTLYSAAGGNVDDLGNIDGVNQWETITSGGDHVSRHEILHNIDDVIEYSVIRVGNLKYVDGTTLFGYLDEWSGELNTLPGAPEYNISTILSSDVWNSLTNIGYDELKIDDIKRLRQKSKVVCKDELKTDKECITLESPCVFDISVDPCETNNIYDKLLGTKIVDDFKNRINRFRRLAIKAGNKLSDKNADPALHNNTWVSWMS